MTDADVADVVALVNDAAEGGPDTVDEAELRNWLADPAPDSAFVVLEDVVGALIAYADLTVHEDRAWLDLRFPRRAIGDAALDALLGWAGERVHDLGLRVLRASVAGTSTLGEMLAVRGFRLIRHSFEMRIDLEAPASDPEWPEGIAVRTLEPGDEHPVYEAVQEAFADHWEFTRRSYEAWAHFSLGAEDFDPSLSFLALEGEEIAGVSLCRPSRPGQPGVGYVRTLAVRRPWRWRGIGLALLLHSFEVLRRRGARAVALGVDAENTTGAVRLYARAGMYVEQRRDAYERRLG